MSEFKNVDEPASGFSWDMVVAIVLLGACIYWRSS